MAKAVLEMAFFDLWAKALGKPLWQVLGGVRRAVEVGVSLGIQPTVEDTLKVVERHLEEATAASSSRSSRAGTTRS